MNPPTRNRVTDSGVRLAMAATAGMPCAAISSHAGSSSARKALTTRCHRTRHDVAVRRTVLGGKVEQTQNAGPYVTAVVGCRRSERNGDCGRDGIVATAEVLVEDLSADTGADDDVADGQRVDRTFVCERERRLSQSGAGPFSAGSELWARAAMPASYATS
jgi:hypothetical protein